MKAFLSKSLLVYTVKILMQGDFPGAPVRLKICLAMQGMWVWSSVRKLRSHMPWSNQATIPEPASQLESSIAATEVPHAVTKAPGSQIN